MDRDRFKQQVQQATDIVSLVGEHVALKARGREFLALCPFHDDKNPSMTLSPAKQIYKCFSCGAGGDVFSFVMDFHKMSFPEAVRHLAERANLELPEQFTRKDSASGDVRQHLLDAHGRAQSFFRQMLAEPTIGGGARDYLARRGVSPEMIETFGIGYAPDQWDALAKRAASAGWPRDAMHQAGLTGNRQSGSGDYDRFRHRLMFPICDAMGRPIAFGGRILPGSQRDDSADAKYLNSPEHPLFNKSQTLFGLHLARPAILESHTAVLVEGYTDVIACHQAGVANVVATLGTALTAEHARLLRRYCDRVILVFDGDEAGLKAADRALSVFFQETLDVAIAVLPEGQDPADLMASPEGLEHWRQAMDRAEDAMGFQFRRVRDAYDRSDSMAGRQRIAEEYLRGLVQLGLRSMDRQRYGLVFARLAELLKMSPGAVADTVRQMGSAERRRETPAAQPDDDMPTAGPSIAHPAHRHVLGCLLNRPELMHLPMPDGRDLSESLLPADFGETEARRFYQIVHDWLCDHETIETGDLRDLFPDEADFRLALDLRDEMEQLTGNDPDRLEKDLRESAALLLPNSDESGHGTSEGLSADEAGALKISQIRERKDTYPSAVVRPRIVT